MFCEKCGNKLGEGDAFCEKCGAPVTQDNPVSETGNANPTNQEIPQNPTFKNNSDVNFQQPAQPNPVQVQPKVKKPFPTKIVIICGAAAVVIAGIIVTLCTLIPYLNRIKPEEYIKVEFDEETLYDGYASADVSIDDDAIENEKVSEDKKSDIDYGKYADNISKGNWGSVINDAVNDYSNYQASVYSILDYCNVTAYLKDAKSESTTGDDSDESYTVTSATVENIGKDDTIVVELKWDNSKDAKKDISEYEKTLGIQFDKSDVKKEFKVSDLLKNDNLTLKELTEVDILKHLTDNNLIRTYGTKDGDLSVGIAPFTYKVDDYTFELSSGNCVNIKDNDDKFVDSFYIEEKNDTDNLKDGDTVTYTTSKRIISDTSLTIKEASTTFTAKINKVMSIDDAKENIDALNSAFNDYIEEYYSALTSYSPVEIYYIQPKKSSDNTDETIILAIEKGKYDGWFNSYDTYYTGIYLENPYIIGETVYSSNIGSRGGDQKLADYKKYENLLKSDDYTCTKILK